MKNKYKLVAFSIINLVSLIILIEVISKYVINYYQNSACWNYYRSLVYLPLKGKVVERFLATGDYRLLKLILTLILYIGWVKFFSKGVANALKSRINLFLYLKGLFLGILVSLSVLVSYYLIGHIRFTIPANFLPNFLINWLLVGVFSTFTAIKEELVFRAYGLSVLIKSIHNPHLANAIQACLFGALHLFNTNASLALLVSTISSGLIFGYLKLRFQNLACVVGFHTAAHLNNTYNSYWDGINPSWISMWGNMDYGLLGRLSDLILILVLAWSIEKNRGITNRVE